MRLLSHFEEVEIVIDSQKEFRLIKSSDRLYRNYQTLMDWSEIFLNNQSFTNFSGSNYNMAILYPMERLFEDYISHLFSKYSSGFKIKLQDKSYFLVEQNGIGKFGLKPDIVLNEPSSSKKIIDTKWKLLDQFAERKNYNISQADMYQLYAYGKKYVLSGTEPRLFLLYPSNPNFTNALDNFIYEGDLKLRVVPFDFNDNEELQIRRIIES
jgi:5-methylcytosine-specific restriction enzyme subunit McrC